MFSPIKEKDGGFVTYGVNEKGKIVGECDIGIRTSPTEIQNILLVDRLKHIKY